MTFRKLSRALAAALIVGGVYAASPVYAAETAAPAVEQSAEEQAPFDVQVVEQHVMATIDRFEKDDIAGLQREATLDLRPHLTAEQVAGAKAEFAP